MNAEIISVSSSLLEGKAINENATFLARELTALGIEVTQSLTIQADAKTLIEKVKEAEQRSDILIFTGGLGPDDDDIVKISLSEHLDKPLVLDDETEDRIITYHKNSGLVMPSHNQLQALTLLDSIPLVNVTGLALGMFYQTENHTYILLPGPSDELIPMFLENTRSLIIDQLLNKAHVSSIIIRLYGLTMAKARQKLHDLFTNVDNLFVGIYEDALEIEVQITSKGESEEETQQLLVKTQNEVESRIEEYIIGYGDDNLSTIVNKLLKEKDLKVTAAESLTGGAFLSKISSEFEAGLVFEGGIVTYSDEIKHKALDVSQEVINEYGVVSAECAIEMADKSLEMFDADIAVSLTGAAGPSSLEGEIPGTVWIGISLKGEDSFAKKFHFGYKRNQNREHSVLTALNLVRLILTDESIEDAVYHKNADQEEEQVIN